MKYIVLLIISAFSTLSLAKTVQFKSCRGDTNWSITSTLDFENNTVTMVSPNRTEILESLDQITSLSKQDKNDLNRDGLVKSSDILSGYKATIKTVRGGYSTLTIYFINRTDKAQLLVLGSFVYGPCR